ncbi:MAG TPA: ZIP family metal transporter [Gallionella sp.]|nr:ZIP family metal transporter [Gallionella sp.]
MSILLWIIAASFAGGVLSVSCAALFALNARPHWVNALISYAIGALLGAAFLEIIPEAIKLSASPAVFSGVLLVGILSFFTLEKLLLWRHCHHGDCEVHDGHSHTTPGRSGLMIMVGDTFHNFVDGVIIAAAFLADMHLGVITALAIIAHEIPQEVGDFMILLHSGYSKARALTLNLVCSVATLVGGVLAYFALQSVQNIVPYFLALAAASMIYVAVADLIPGLHRRARLRDTVEQVTMIVLGICSIILTNLIAEV